MKVYKGFAYLFYDQGMTSPEPILQDERFIDEQGYFQHEGIIWLKDYELCSFLVIYDEENVVFAGCPEFIPLKEGGARIGIKGMSTELYKDIFNFKAEPSYRAILLTNKEK